MDPAFGRTTDRRLIRVVVAIPPTARIACIDWRDELRQPLVGSDLGNDGAGPTCSVRRDGRPRAPRSRRVFPAPETNRSAPTRYLLVAAGADLEHGNALGLERAALRPLRPPGVGREPPHRTRAPGRPLRPRRHPAGVHLHCRRDSHWAPVSPRPDPLRIQFPGRRTDQPLPERPRPRRV